MEKRYPLVQTEQGWIAHVERFPNWTHFHSNTRHTTSLPRESIHTRWCHRCRKQEKISLFCSQKHIKTPHHQGIRKTITSNGLTRLILPDDGRSFVVQSSTASSTEEVQNGRRFIFFFGPLIHVTQGDQTGLPLLRTGFGIAELEWFEEGLRPQKQNAYAFFMEGLPYRFYPILLLFSVWALPLSGRDFGPMYDAENKQLSDLPSRKKMKKSFSWGVFYRRGSLICS